MVQILDNVGSYWIFVDILFVLIITVELFLNASSHLANERWTDDILDVSNKVDIARFPLQYATIDYDFSFDGYLHSSRLRNYGGRVHISLLLVQILSKKWQRRK